MKKLEWFALGDNFYVNKMGFIDNNDITSISYIAHNLVCMLKYLLFVISSLQVEH